VTSEGYEEPNQPTARKCRVVSSNKGSKVVERAKPYLYNKIDTDAPEMHMGIYNFQKNLSTKNRMLLQKTCYKK